MKIRRNIGIKTVTVIVWVAVFLSLCVTCSVLFLNTYYTQQIAYDCLMDKTNLYMKVLNKNIWKVTQEIKQSQRYDGSLIGSIPTDASPQDTQYYPLWRQMAEYNFKKAVVVDEKYAFFEYNRTANLLLYEDAVYFAGSERNEFVRSFVGALDRRYDAGINGIVWSYLPIGGKTYLYCCFSQGNTVVGCVIDLQELTRDFNISNMGYSGSFLFEDGDGVYYPSGETEEMEDIEAHIPDLRTTESKIGPHYAWQTYRLNFVGSVKVVIQLSSGVLARNMRLQVFSFVAFALILAMVLYAVRYFYKRLLMPMRRFTERLKNPEQDAALDDKGLVELIYADSEFRRMYSELQSLRISLYEKEIENQSVMLEYAQEQIKPHFFLNCMSVVQSLAELHHEREIVQILDTLSDYMKYVLKDTFQMRRIGDEVDHLQEYMSIQQLCKKGQFRYSAFVEEGLEEYKIIPLLLQAFGENSVKHRLVPDRCIEIDLYITKMELDGQDYIYIALSDTGNGFSQDILDRIAQDQPIVYGGCEHLGIRNTLKRIRMIYGNKAQVRLSNMKEHYGAVVEVMLPVAEELPDAGDDRAQKE